MTVTTKTPTTVIDPAHLADRVREMVQSGRVRAARPLLAALRKAAPDLPTPDRHALDELEARLLLREGRVADALTLLDRALAATPDALALLLCRAEARMLSGDVTGGAADAANAVIAAPDHAPAKAMLGVFLIELDRIAEAIACLAEAVAQAPRNPSYRIGLAEAQERAGNPEEAARVLREGVLHAPGNTRLRIAGIMVAMRQLAFAQAIALAEAARQAGAADACVFGLLGHALSNLGRHEASRDAYGEALKLAPDDPALRQFVHSAATLRQASRSPDSVVPEALAVLSRG